MSSYPTKAEHVNTYHRAENKIPRAHLAGPMGWCQLHVGSDEPGVAYAAWRNPITGETHEVVVCEKHKEHPHVVDVYTRKL